MKIRLTCNVLIVQNWCTRMEERRYLSRFSKIIFVNSSLNHESQLTTGIYYNSRKLKKKSQSLRTKPFFLFKKYSQIILSCIME